MTKEEALNNYLAAITRCEAAARKNDFKAANLYLNYVDETFRVLKDTYGTLLKVNK